MSETITAPFTDEQVRLLNEWQQHSTMHPFTCRRRTETPHGYHDSRDFGVLVATRDGWVCRDCDYTQDWAHDFMAAPLFPMDEHTRLWADEIRNGEEADLVECDSHRSP